jgi:hypothetical protein
MLPEAERTEYKYTWGLKLKYEVNSFSISSRASHQSIVTYEGSGKLGVLVGAFGTGYIYGANYGWA